MGIFTKKDTNTITGEDKFKGWGNTKEKVFESEKQKGAVTAAAGGDLKGKDFREFKRDVHKQKRLNRRALRRAERGSIDQSRAAVKILTQRRNALGKETDENRVKLQRLNRAIDRHNVKIKQSLFLLNLGQ